MQLVLYVTDGYFINSEKNEKKINLLRKKERKNTILA